MQQAASKPVNNQVNSGWGGSGAPGGVNVAVDEDDGGWGMGPPGVGSGWMGKFPIPPMYPNCGLAANSGDMSSWQGPAGDWKPNVIVDRNDKEAWPSIGGDNSETTSDNGDDSASVKSGSVISSSSQDHSALWGNSLNGLESNTWDTIPSSTSLFSSYPQSLSNNMQGINSIAGSSDPARGWGNVPGPLPQGLGQIQGGNRPQNSVQIQQSAADSMQSSHSVSNQASYGAYTSAFKPVGDSWGAVGTIPSDVAGKGNGNSAQKSDQSAGAGWPGNPTTTLSSATASSDWGDATSTSTKQWPSDSKEGLQPQPTSWAQAAGKGLSTSPSNPVSNQNAQSQSISQSDTLPNEYLQVIDSHDGWGLKPVRQDTAWETETTPKAKRKFPPTGPANPEKPPTTANNTTTTTNNNNNSNMWNNNNGTGIWASTKEPQQSSTWTSAPSGNSSQWEDPQPKDPNTWTNPPGSSSNQWDGTETGSWPSEQSGQWGQAGKQGVNDGTALWGNPGGKPANWNQPPASAPPQRPNWNQAPPPPPTPTQPPAGWGQGQPNGPPPAKVDDGTCLWAAGSPKQAQAAGWGETNNQWNPAIGQKPKPASWSEDPSIKVRLGNPVVGVGTVSSSSHMGPDGDRYWNRPPDQGPNPKSTFNWGEADMIWNTSDYNKDDMFWNEDKTGSWEDTDMGTWMDETQENNSTWSSASGWNRGKKTLIKGASRFPGGSQPQMRSRMLQQLMELGFQKDEAQHALISNNMNYQSALADLYKKIGATYRDDAVLLDSAKSKVISDNDISDTQQENNPFVPNPNTPFPPPNAQPFKGPSQPVSSQTSIMPPQQNKKPAAGRGGSNPATSQQMTQQHILQQLHLAVKAGLISPQLLNRQLPPFMLVLLQQLLQHQACLQQLITTQQVCQKESIKFPTPATRQQLEQVNIKINTIKQQILHFQRQIHEAQRLLKPQASTTQSTEDSISSIQSELSNLNIATTQPQQSKLSQWKKPTEKESSPDSGANAENSALNKAPGSSKASQPSSQSSLQYGGLGLTQLGGDSTWSNVPTTPTSQSWPTINVSASGSTPTLDENGKDSKESLSSTSSSLTINDAIPEFVPGKPWPGITQKNVEDDPHITPGSFSRSLSLSVNTVKDDYLGSLTKTSPSESLPWSSTNSKNMSQKSWSGGDNMTPTSFSNEVWGVPLPKNSAMQHSRPPPGLPQQKASNWSGVNRQHSWAGTRTDPSSFNSGNMSNWDSRMSNNITPCLILKNLTPQIDGSTLRTLCMQHGPLIWFYLSLNNGQALVRYQSKEEAFKAQKSLNTCVLGNTTIVAEFVSDNEAARFAMQCTMANAQSSQWQSQPNNSMYRQNNVGLCNDSWNSQPAQANHMANNYNTGGMWGSGGSGLWGGGDDHNANTLLGNMLGESM